MTLALLVACLASCQIKRSDNPDGDNPSVKNPITVTSPRPTEQITKVDLTEAESAYAEAGNSMAVKLFGLLGKGAKSFLLSPLSIQYALGMTANGASGETLDQIVKALGFADGSVEALNAYCNKLLNQLPAVDLDVTLSLADALLVNEACPLLPAFQKTVEQTYYAAVENMPFSDAEEVAARINDWSSRNTNGLIDKMLEAKDIDPAAIAYLMNALYFKAKWAGEDPLFEEGSTYEQDFYPGGCDVITVPTMHGSGQFNYAAMKGFQMLELPYAGGKYAMYILLPEGEGGGDPAEDAPEMEIYTFHHLLQDLPSLDWKAMVQQLKPRTVLLSLPKFETSSSFLLNETLQALGIERAFSLEAQFDRMFDDPRVDAMINKVIQKARIAVAEWGTEAAAVTVVEMVEKSAFPGDDPVQFTCDHPFAWFIAEKTSGVILFEGAYWGN